MLIPHEDGQWSWDDGEKFDTREEALASAQVSVVDGAPQVYTVDAVETMTIEGDD